MILGRFLDEESFGLDIGTRTKKKTLNCLPKRARKILNTEHKKRGNNTHDTVEEITT